MTEPTPAEEYTREAAWPPDIEQRSIDFSVMETVQALGGPLAVGATAVGVAGVHAAKDIVVAKIQANKDVKVAQIQADASKAGGQGEGAAN